MLLHNLLCSAQRARPNYGRVLLRAACAASITGVFYSAQRARPQLRACFAPRSVRGLNYGRVLLRAACAASITGAFYSAQRARPQLRACFAPRSVRDPITGVFELKSRVILLSIEVWGAKNTRIPSLQPFWCGCPASVAMGFRPLERPYSHPSQMCSAPIDTISLRRRPSQHPILD